MPLAQPMLKLLYQDEHIVVVHKPSGLLVHRSNIDRHETVFLIQQLRDQIGQQVFPVHRLDKPTSGLMVLALHKTAARELSNSFTEKQVSKAYIAIVRGYVSNQVIDYPLKEEQDKNANVQLRRVPNARPWHRARCRLASRPRPTHAEEIALD